MIRYTYLIEDNNGLVKIGRSSYPEERLKQLRREASSALTPDITDRSSLKLLCTYKRNIEASLHELFNDYKYLGEWFDLPPITKESLISSFAAPTEALILDRFGVKVLYEGDLSILYFWKPSQLLQTQKSAKAATKADSQLTLAY